ncbi:hypothetical protein GOFOIKOB_5947 [Methylobacterium tardum]|uniref:Uncharacterized protein n=1 Tax=Methylobacterium tardum TaxID=374432 RepID=A0AA37WRN3_9HYPH|nr:hypothetical protein [Methylobacterium tardum]URD39550.1 hypothetical protein M6G65_14815 [Methylobacterium tardum]GJE52872.1 hypothetical protein GOFOIKOB_5947 [Methylobacterium tardum]GLS68188.1 hypothetical protein GCM10007890_02000 [Methylobacterium tardum]
MTATIIPLRSSRDATSALATFDVAAAALLTEGGAASLSAARLDVILQRLRAQRAELVALITDLQMRGSSGNAQLDAINADLGGEADKGLAQIDLLIRHIEARTTTTECSGAMG